MKKKVWIVLFALISALCLCLGLAACGGGEPDAEKGADGHTHVAEHFQVDENGHWKICTECGEKFSVGDHSYNSDNACETCGYSTVYTEGLRFVLDEETDTYIVDGLGKARDATDLIIPAYHEGKAVTSIGSYAFQYCSGLTSITIPNSVTSIGKEAFEGTAYYNDASHWENDEVLYIGNHLIEAKRTISGAYSVRQGTKNIADYAFSGGTGLTSITIPNSVTSIGSGAFQNCSGLTSITIPDSVTSIGSRAFYGCSGLTSITIPDSVTSIEWGTFSGCTGLTSITIPDSVTSIGSGAFYGCVGLTSITIPDSVASIGYQAFSYCVNLTSITIPDSVTSIGYQAFIGCSGLTSITIPDSVTSIGGDAFYNTAYYNDASHWEDGEVLYIGNHLIEAKNTISGAYSVRQGIKTIAGYAFYNCSGLESVTIGSGVTSIGYMAFEDCIGLKEVHITDLAAWCKIDFEYDSSNPLYYAHHLYLNGDEVTQLTIPADVTSIGSWAFYGCSGLESVTIGSGVTSIGDSAFRNCTGLTSITIPDSVTSIGEYAFNSVRDTVKNQKNLLKQSLSRA